MKAPKKRSQYILAPLFCWLVVQNFIILQRIQPPRVLTSDAPLLAANTTISAVCQNVPSNFTHNKGIVLFYHIGKTGGSTVRSLFGNLEEQDPDTFVNRRWFDRQWKPQTNETDCSLPMETERLLQKLDHSIHHHMENKTRSRLQLIELHGSVPGMTYLAPYIHQWRQLAHSLGASFFAFTLVRDPLPFSLSYFRFFHVNCRDRWCERRQFPHTVDGLLSSVRRMPNRQCASLHQRQSFTTLKPKVMRQCLVQDCQAVTRLTEQALDWIGTTERLSYDTLRLLSYMLTGSTLVNNVANAKVSVSDTTLQNLTDAERRELDDLLHMDLQLYDRVREKYSLGKTLCLPE